MTYLIIVSASIIGAYLLGSKRRIGFWWTLFFCTFFGVIIGIGLAFGSSQEKRLMLGYKPSDTKLMKLISPVLLLLSAVLFYYGLTHLQEYYSMLLLMPAVGLFGGFIYLLTTYERAYTNDQKEAISKQIDGLIVIVISCTFLVCMTTKW